MTIHTKEQVAEIKASRIRMKKEGHDCYECRDIISLCETVQHFIEWATYLNTYVNQSDFRNGEKQQKIYELKEQLAESEERYRLEFESHSESQKLLARLSVAEGELAEAREEIKRLEIRDAHSRHDKLGCCK